VKYETTTSLKEFFSSFENHDFNGLNLRPYKQHLLVAAQNALSNWTPRRSLERSHESDFQVIDFFSGCGGMSLGFAALSTVHPFFELIGGCDINPEPCLSYRSNFNVPCIDADVRTLLAEGAMGQLLAKFVNYQRSKPLIVIGCPPCQGFTSHRKKNWDKVDYRNELVEIFAGVAVSLNPECIVMENVPEILSQKYNGTFAKFTLTLQSAGYYVRQAIFNAASFGVPQDRFRAIVIAMKQEFLLPDPLLNVNQYISVRQAIGGLPPLSAGEKSLTDGLHQSVHHRPETLKTISAVPKNGGNRPHGVGPKCLDRVKGFSDVYGRLYWDRPSITITQYSRNPASGRFVHPEQDRGLTMREAANIQSFPKGFVFCGSKSSIFKQIGEAVPPKMACAIASNVIVELLSEPPSGQEKHESIASINQPVCDSYSSLISKLKQARFRECIIHA